MTTSRTSTSKKAKDYGPAEEYYFKLRENWSNVEVLLLSILEDVPIAEGHMYKAFVDSDSRGPPCEDVVPIGKRKRSYNSSKRTKPDPAESLSRNASKKKLLRCSQENVSDALKVRCPCTSDYLRKVSHKDVLDERIFFYNEPYTKKVEYILGKFDHPGTLKPKDTTLFAKASLKTFFERTVEPLPHIECKNDETDGVTYRLPKAYSREDVYAQVREKMIAVNMAPISKVALENIWKKDFLNYGIHNSNAFAKCAKSIYFMNMLHRERRSAERANWEHQREMHLKHQISELHYHVHSEHLRDYVNYYTGSKIGDLEFRNAASHELFNALLDEEVFTKTVLMKKGKTSEEYFFSSEEDGRTSEQQQDTTRMLPHESVLTIRQLREGQQELANDGFLQ
ncbi:hypothetical protein R1sor_010357 [Riccia sorocarpa]|uniref:Uncharacterized protein n=1 Tax=Riccia sorocarpa TaxID=122646 RepID=A0ABD3I1V1_9MARC